MTDENNSDKETERRREDALKRMLATPPQPHSESVKASKSDKTTVRKKRVK